MLIPDTLTLAGKFGFAGLDASLASQADASRETASNAAFLFAVVGILLILFFALILLTTVSRALRGKRAAIPTQATDISVDAWSEAGKRLGRPKTKRSDSTDTDA